MTETVRQTPADGPSAWGVRGTLALVGTLALATAASACPNCKDGLGESGLAEGFAWSIAILMSMPFLILGSLAGYFYLLVRAARRATAARQAAETGADDAGSATDGGESRLGEGLPGGLALEGAPRAHCFSPAESVH